MSAGSEVREQLRSLTAPLEVELRSIDERIKQLDEELASLREARRDVVFVLKRLDPETVKPKKQQGRPPRDDRSQEILAFIASHNGDYGDGIIYSNVFKAMKAEGIAIGKETVKTVFDELHAQGVIRLDRTVSGGGKAYKLVGHD